jgi:succinate-acetate transporter protein
VADPAPLGLAAFALTTFILSLANANVYPAAAGAAVYTAIAYGGSVQLLAGMWEFKRNNTFGATAFSSFGGFWIAVFFMVQVGHIIPGAPGTSTVFGTFFLAWTIFTAYMFIASLRVSGAVALVFLLLTVTFVFLTIGAFHSSSGWTKTGGWFGVATAAAAWYASFAGVTNSTFRRTVLPVYPLADR